MTGLHLEAEVGLSIGEELHGALKKHHEETKKPKPLYLRRGDSKIGNGTSLVTLDVGAPPTGRMWVVTFCSLFGIDDHTVVASVLGAIYTGNPNSLALTGLINSGLAFPSSTQISDDVLWVHANENLCVQTSAPGVAGQQYGVNFVVQEWRDSEISQRSGR